MLAFAERRIAPHAATVSRSWLVEKRLLPVDRGGSTHDGAGA
jgi:hypothetical protein